MYQIGSQPFDDIMNYVLAGLTVFSLLLSLIFDYYHMLSFSGSKYNTKAADRDIFVTIDKNIPLF